MRKYRVLIGGILLLTLVAGGITVVNGLSDDTNKFKCSMEAHQIIKKDKLLKNNGIWSDEPVVYDEDLSEPENLNRYNVDWKRNFTTPNQVNGSGQHEINWKKVDDALIFQQYMVHWNHQTVEKSLFRPRRMITDVIIVRDVIKKMDSRAEYYCYKEIINNTRYVYDIEKGELKMMGKGNLKLNDIEYFIEGVEKTENLLKGKVMKLYRPLKNQKGSITQNEEMNLEGYEFISEKDDESKLDITGDLMFTRISAKDDIKVEDIELMHSYGWEN